MKRLSQNQHGLGHVLIIILAVVVLGGIGFAGYRVINKDKKSVADTAASAVSNAVKQAALKDCEKENDKDICKFYAKWELNQNFSMTTVTEAGDTTLYEIDGENTHMKSSGGDIQYEMITIGKVTYTKAGDKWYKQAEVETGTTTPTPDPKPEITDPKEDTTTEEGPKTEYKLIGKEACGKLTCFKYQIIYSDAPETKEYIWFDDKDYLTRKSRSETPEGFSESTYEYNKVSVKEPSPVVELKANEYIIPGQTEPTTLPTAADFAQ